MIRRPLILLLVLVLLSSTAEAAAQPGEQTVAITLTAEVGFDGYYRRNEWTPVRVTVANSGPDVEGFIVVEQTGSSPTEVVRYQAPVSLPGQSRKTVALYIGTETYQAHMTVKMVSDGQTLVQVRVPVIQVGEQAKLHAVVSGAPVELSVLERAGPPGQTAYVAYLTLDQLPSLGPAWGALDLLVLNDVDTAGLTPSQLSALQGWLAAGGHLVVTGGPGWRKTAANLGELLPVSISGSVSSSDLSVLAKLTGAAVGDGPFVVAQAELLPVSRTAVPEVRTLFGQDDRPLLARRREGLGKVDWLALDLALAPLQGWAGGEGLWRTILSDSGSRAPWDSTTINVWAAREGLRAIPSLALPSALQLVLFLLAYTALIGPVNYLVLKRAQRRELAWLTIPAIILLFSGLAYITGFQIRGGDVVLNRLSLVYGAAGADSARARTLVGIFSPNRATYDVFFPGGALVRPLISDAPIGPGNSAVVEQGHETVLRDLQLDVGGLRTFRVESHVLPPSIDGSLAISSANVPHLTGSVTWGQLRPDAALGGKPAASSGGGEVGLLESAGLLVGETVIELGDLAPGQTVSVDTYLTGGRAARAAYWSGVSGWYPSAAPPAFGYLPMDKLVGGTDYWNDRVLNRRFQTLQAFVSTGETVSPFPRTATFFAWSEQPLWDMDVAGAQSQTLDTVGYFLELPLSLASRQGSLVVPPALTTWEPLHPQRPGETGPYGFYLTNEWVGFQYQPWEAFQLARVEELVLTIEASQRQGRIRVALWDWSSES